LVLVSKTAIMKNKSLLITIALLVITNSLTAQVTDKDGNHYDTVMIGEQEWTAENLNVSHFRNRDSIPEIEDIKEWQKAGDKGKPAWCYYNSDSVSGKIYGKLYNWYAVSDPRGLAPDGWHIPSTSEWGSLEGYLGSDNTAGTKMKVTKGWDGTNTSGFTALPGGYRNNSSAFVHISSIGSWWSSSETTSDTTSAWSRSLGYGDGVVSRSYDSKRVGLSVRCIK
jgi:uncharacterized protein (TIGR02145 family)